MKVETITCIQCERTFVFSDAERNRLLANGFDMPRRCPECRKNRARIAETQQHWKPKDRKKHRRRRDDFSMDEEP